MVSPVCQVTFLTKALIQPGEMGVITASLDMDGELWGWVPRTMKDNAVERVCLCVIRAHSSIVLRI